MASLFTPPAGDNPDSTLPPLPETPPSEPTTSHTSDVHQGTITKKPAIERVRANENQAITRTQDRLDEKNWAVWRLRLTLMLEICGVQGYVEGKIPRPDPAQDPDGATNWDFNDTYAKVLIANNVTTTQMMYIKQTQTSHENWCNLEAIHDAKSHQTTIGIIQNLYRTTAAKENNILDHLNQLKLYWECINLMADDDFKVSDNQFKVLISSSLPSSWDTFTEGYVGRQRDVPETDPRKLMSSQQFIGVLKEEATRRDARRAESSHLITSASDPGSSKQKYCVICKHNNYNTSECRNKDKKPCGICKKLGHKDDDCWHRDKRGKRKQEGKPKGGNAKRQKMDTTNEAEHEEDDAMQVEEVTFMTKEDNNLTNHVNNIMQNDKPVTFYDWVADSATTSHICNQRDAFVTYKPITGKTVSGVGNTL